MRVASGGVPEIDHLIAAFNRMAQAVAATQAALSSSEQRLRLAPDAASMAAWHWDVASGELQWGDDLSFLFSVVAGERLSEFPSLVIDEDREVLPRRRQDRDANRRGLPGGIPPGERTAA